jgi:serine phosphatase RsbU (regulator of sigma subunit)
MAVLETLRDMPLFNGFDEQDFERLIGSVKPQHLSSGEVLFDQGDTSNEGYIIIDGELEVVGHLNGMDVQLGVRGAGEMIGEMALIDSSPRSAMVRATKPSIVAAINEDVFYTLLHRNATLAVEMLRRGTASLRNTSQRMIARLEAKNAELTRAYEDLKQAQDELIYLNRIQEEMTVARRIQKQFLPATLPQLPGWQLAALNRGAQAVGGDFFDVINLPGNHLGLVVADVCGKGVPAALFVALTRSLLRSASQAPWIAQHGVGANANIEDLLSAALWFTNDYIAREHGESGIFITMFYGILNPETGILSYVNAGHNPPLIFDATGEIVQELESETLPLGIIESQIYEVSRIQLAPGHTLVSFSDGVTEAMNVLGEPYGDEQFVNILRANIAQSADELLRTVIADVDRYAAGAPQADDITLLLLKRAA